MTCKEFYAKKAVDGRAVLMWGIEAGMTGKPTVAPRVWIAKVYSYYLCWATNDDAVEDPGIRPISGRRTQVRIARGKHLRTFVFSKTFRLVDGSRATLVADFKARKADRLRDSHDVPEVNVSATERVKHRRLAYARALDYFGEGEL